MREMVESDVRRGMPDCRVLGGPQVERAVGDQVQEGHEDHGGEDDDLDQPEGGDLVEHDGPWVEKHDLDVEDDEDHRHQVEAHRKALWRLTVGHDPALVGRQLGQGRLLARRQHGGRHQGEHGEGEAKEPQEKDRQVLVHGGPFLPCDPSLRHIEATGRNAPLGAYDEGVPADAAATPADPPTRSPRSPTGRLLTAPRQTHVGPDRTGPRCRHRRRRSGRILVRLLAGRRRLGRGGGGEEALPPRQDVRRRPHPARRAPTGRHGPRGSPGRVAQVQRPAGLRLRAVPGDAMA